MRWYKEGQYKCTRFVTVSVHGVSMHAALLAGLGPEKMLPLGAIVVSLQNFWQLSKLGLNWSLLQKCDSH